METTAISSHQTEVEPIVNRWLVDYYVFLALESFKNDQYSNFCEIRDVIDNVLTRPCESTHSTPVKIRVLQLLSRINEGERLDMSFESDQSITPLESALMLLERMNQESSLPKQDLETVVMSVKEMMVGVYIKNNMFDKAKEMINKHFPKPMVGKKAIFMGLIKQKSKMHHVIEQLDFRRFKKDVFEFCKRLCPFTVPFLYKAAKQLIDKRLTGAGEEAAGPDEQDKPSRLSGPQINTEACVTCERRVIQKSRLEAVYKALAADLDERTFSQLEEEVENEEQVKTKERSLHLSEGTDRKVGSKEPQQIRNFPRGSVSPMEASPADHQTQTVAVSPTQPESHSNTNLLPERKRLYTVARLVVEPDSLPCTPQSQDLEAEVTGGELAQSPGTDSDVTSPSQKRCRTSACLALELSSDSEEEIHTSVSSCRVHQRKVLTEADSSPSRDPGNTDNISDSDNCPLPSTPRLCPLLPDPRRSSTPHTDHDEDPGPSNTKWKQLFTNAKESKETWAEEEILFTKDNESHESILSNSSLRKKWTESETQKLKIAVQKFGEGNWSKIKSYYNFEGRTNVNLKDRWRTMKKMKMV